MTGGPGCGKSFTVRWIVNLARAKNANMVLVAPTGRAAKRLSELTGHQASTVHRLLACGPVGSQLRPENPLDADLVVVDEASMLDLILANKLVKAIPPGAQCYWSVTSTSCPRSAPGRSCAICSPRGDPPGPPGPDLPPGAQPLIVTNAHRVNAGKPPHLITGSPTSSWFRQRPTADDTASPTS